MVSSPAKRTTTIIPYARVPAPKVTAQLRAVSLEYSAQELAVATSSWDASRRLGSGCYGAVYRGEMKDGTEVAIKVIDLGVLIGKGESPEDAGFDEEVMMLSKFRHPNLVTLVGWGQAGLSRYLIYEFLAGGDVFQRLHKSRSHGRGRTFLWYERLTALQDAATGLSHMHNSTPKAFHRDIKSANILLDRHGTAKMADFGLSCICSQAGVSHVTVKTISGTPGYKCPIYERSGRFTEGSEVFSFGMVMMEVVTGLDPSAADPHTGGITFPIAEQIAPTKAGAADRCLQNLDASASWMPALALDMCQLAIRSVMPDERTRPMFVDIVRTLRGLAERHPRNGIPRPTSPIATCAVARSFSPPPLVYSSPMALKVGAKTIVGDTKVTNPVISEGLFYLEFIAGLGCDAEAVPPEYKRVNLCPGPNLGENSQAQVVLGRHQQQQHFETWLPDQETRNCISRKAILFSWSPGGENVCMQVFGPNPVEVDGKLVLKGVPTMMWPGAEISFPFEGKILLHLRFRTCRQAVACSRACGGAITDVSTSTGSNGVSSTPSADNSASAAGCVSDSTPVGLAASMPQVTAAGSLQCIYAEGIPQERLEQIPPDLREIRIPRGTTLIGRHHQPGHFEMWLPDQNIRYCISRRHFQIDATNGGFEVTNMSTNMLCIDKVPLEKGESRIVHHGQEMSFARTENSNTVTHFLVVQVSLCDAPRGTPASHLRVISPSKINSRTSPPCSRSPTKRQGRPTIVAGASADDEIIIRTTAKAPTIPAQPQGFLQSPQSPRERRVTPVDQAPFVNPWWSTRQSATLPIAL